MPFRLDSLTDTTHIFLTTGLSGGEGIPSQSSLARTGVSLAQQPSPRQLRSRTQWPRAESGVFLSPIVTRVGCGGWDETSRPIPNLRDPAFGRRRGSEPPAEGPGWSGKGTVSQTSLTPGHTEQQPPHPRGVSKSLRPRPQDHRAVTTRPSQDER